MTAMNNAFQFFESTQFGSIRTMVNNGEPMFVGKDVALALGDSLVSETRPPKRKIIGTNK